MAFRRKIEIKNPLRDIRSPELTKPIGVMLPFNNPRGIFNLSYTNRDQVYSNLRNLLLTAKGERYNLPDFGTDLKTVLFEQISDEEDFKDRLRGEIESAISIWMPYINIQVIEVNLNANEDGSVVDSEHVVNIFLRVSISGTNIYLPIRIFISESMNIRIEEAGV